MLATQDIRWKQEYPFDSNFAIIDGHRMHYVDEGQGHPLVFVHGNPTWSFHWRFLMAGLRDRYRVIAPDHLGCGLSDKPQRYPYDMTHHSANLAELIARLGLESLTLVGHDWGGAIGLHAALLQSSTPLTRVILFNTAAFPPPRVPRRIALCRTPLIGRLLIRGLNAFPRAALHMALADPRRLSRQGRAGILYPYRSWRDRVGIWRFIVDIPRSNRHPTYRELAKLQESLVRLGDTPVCLMWGMQDWCFDESCLLHLLQRIPHAEVHRLEQAGHWAVEDAPHEVLKIAKSFLHRTAPASPVDG